jgi:outer membrane receptor for ferrienterochelin and colicins
LDLVERVEIIRGPGSSLYGNNAFFTVINVVTRRGRDLNGFEVSGGSASYDTYRGRVTYGNHFKSGMELLVSGTYLNSVGNDQFHVPELNAINNGIAEDSDGTELKSTFASLSFKDFTLEGGFIDRRKHSPTAQYGTLFNDPRMLDVDERGYAELKFAHEFENGWAVQSRAYYDHYRFDGVFPYNYSAPSPGPTTINHERDQAEWVGAELLVSKTLWEHQRLTLGSEYRRDFRLDLANFDLNPPATYVNSQEDSESFAFYAQDEARLFTNVIVNAGVRYDHFSTFGDTVNPRGAVIYSPWREGTFKFIYGEAFRAPNQYELNYVQPTFRSNPGLQPETVRSYELVYEQGLSHALRASGSLFLNEIHGLIGQTDVGGTNFFDNLDQVEARGFETELEGHWEGGWMTRLSYTFTDAYDRSTGDTLNNSPRHLVKANAVAPLWQDKIFAGLELQAMSSRRTVQGNETGAFWVANVTLYSRELVKHLEFSASVYNLFDRRYDDPVSADYAENVVRQTGRTFRVKLTYHF